MTNLIQTVALSTNLFVSSTNFFTIPVHPKDPTAIVTMHGYKRNDWLDYDQVHFHWTNLTVKTIYRPQITESNGWWIIKLKERK